MKKVLKRGVVDSYNSATAIGTIRMGSGCIIRFRLDGGRTFCIAGRGYRRKPWFSSLNIQKQPRPGDKMIFWRVKDVQNVIWASPWGYQADWVSAKESISHEVMAEEDRAVASDYYFGGQRENISKAMRTNHKFRRKMRGLAREVLHSLRNADPRVITAMNHIDRGWKNRN
jgi:hypothetical protein